METKPLINYVFTVLIFFFVSCQKETTEPILEELPVDELPVDYAFFVAGHTYGSPTNYQYGLHPPFVNSIPFINDYPLIELGVLTGDVVHENKQAYWDAALIDISNFLIPIHLAAGNHDRGALFESIFGAYFYYFKKGNDLFIILSPTAWNIADKQKAFLEQTIKTFASEVNNIFIFCHELIWWSPENKFSGIEINYRPHYPGINNYWNEIHPLLDDLENNVVLFAGDLGAKASASPYMYHKMDNVTFVASGMGGGQADNIIIIEVLKDGSLRYRLFGINDKLPFEILNLTDFVLP